jgi:hypothetical protein
MYEVVDAAPGAPVPPPPRSGSVQSGSIVYSSAPAAGDEAVYAAAAAAAGYDVADAAAEVPVLYAAVDRSATRRGAADAQRADAQRANAQRAKAMVANATFDTSQNKNSAAVKRTNKEEMTPAKSHALPTRKSVTDAIEAAGNVNKLEARRMLRKAGKRPGMYVLWRDDGAVVVVTAVNDNKEFIEFRVRRTGMNDDRSVTLFGTMSDINPTFDNAVDAVMFLHTPNSTSKTDQRITHLVAAAATI